MNRKLHHYFIFRDAIFVEVFSGLNLSKIRKNGKGLNLSGVDLSGVDLRRANLNKSNLNGVNLSGAKIFSAKEFMKKNFEKTDEGYIVYKAFYDTIYDIPSYWIIEKNSYIEETCNLNPTSKGSGVNFGTKSYILKCYHDCEIWKCLLEFEDLIECVVPYNSDGKARCSRLKLLEEVNYIKTLGRVCNDKRRDD